MRLAFAQHEFTDKRESGNAGRHGKQSIHDGEQPLAKLHHFFAIVDYEVFYPLRIRPRGGVSPCFQNLFDVFLFQRFGFVPAHRPPRLEEKLQGFGRRKFVHVFLR